MNVALASFLDTSGLGQEDVAIGATEDAGTILRRSMVGNVWTPMMTKSMSNL